MTELRQIPNVGKRTEQELLAMGYTSIESLCGKSGEELYVEECRLRGCTIDRCQLYLYRAVSYFVNTEHPDRNKCKWWLWKDEVANPSPCGAVCAECGNYPASCRGCRVIEGQVFWLSYTGDDECPVSHRFPSTAVAGSRGGQIAGVVPNCLAGVLPKTPRLATKRTKPT